MPTSGVQIGEIGDRYDIALGYNATDVTSPVMYGYVMPAGGRWEVSSALAEDPSLRSTASPNAVDARDVSAWPKVSQGDWSGGEGQVFFVDPTRYLSSTGVNVFTPGQLEPAWDLITKALPASWTSQFGAMISDGLRLYIGGTDGTHNLAVLGADGTMRTFTVGGTSAEILDLFMGPDAVYIATGSGGQIWKTNGFVDSPTFTQVVNDLNVGNNQGGGFMTYAAANIYYIKGAGLQQATTPYPGNNPGTSAWSGFAQEANVNNLLAAGSGLFFTTAAWTFANPHGTTRLYSFSGTGQPTLLGELPGFPVGSAVVNGIVYLVLFNQQFSWRTGPPFGGTGIGGPYYTLYSVTGSVISVIDDTRYTSPDVRGAPFFGGGVTTEPPPTRVGVTGDGRFLFVSFPGWGILQYDMASPAIPPPRCMVFDQTAVDPGAQPRWSVALSGLYGLCFYTANNATTASLRIQTKNTASGQPVFSLSTSFFDFSTPDTPKIWRNFTLETTQLYNVTTSPLPSVTAFVDSNPTGIVLSVIPSRGSQAITCLFPAGTKGNRVRFVITLTIRNPMANLQIWQTLRSYSVKANLGRVWKVSVSCRRGQTMRQGEVQTQLRAIDLIANLENIYANAGVCTLFVPSPQAGAGVTPPYVEQVNAILDRLTWKTVGGVSPAYRMTEDGMDAEADADLVLIESL